MQNKESPMKQKKETNRIIKQKSGPMVWFMFHVFEYDVWCTCAYGTIKYSVFMLENCMVVIVIMAVVNSNNYGSPAPVNILDIRNEMVSCVKKNECIVQHCMIVRQAIVNELVD